MTGRDSGPPGASRGDNPTEVLRASASLLARCAGCWLDEHERAAGWKVYYAIDVDVIATYMAPARNPRFGAVLSAERRPAELLARLLSDFVLRQVRGSAVPTDGCTSLFIIPPHDDELHRMLNAVHSKAHERKIAPGRWTELAELVRGVESDPEIAATLVAHAGDLLRLLDDDGPHEELNRFGSLPRNRLLNLFRYRESSDGEEFSFPSPPVDSSSPEFDDYVDRYERWRNALQRVRTEAVEQERPYATRRDARVLATLEWINQRLKTQLRRLVLITGSHSIFEAALDLGRESGRPNEHEFIDLFLRHPHAFLGDDGFFSTSNQSEETDSPDRRFRVSEWLNLLLPRFIDRTGTGRQVRLAELRAEKFTDERAASLDSPVEEWNDQVRTLAAKHGIELAAEDPTSRAAKILKKLNEHMQGSWSIEGVQRYLVLRSKQTRNTLFMSTMILGALQLRHAGSRICGVPALRFDGPYKQAQEIADSLQAHMFRGTLAIDLHSLYETLKAPDSEGYHAFVLHAFAYAIAGHWYGTRTLCTSALEVADAIPRDQQNYRTGREAAYLLAVAERRVASNQQELDESRKSLADARDRENPGAPEDVRFRSEALANEVARVNLDSFGPEPSTWPLSSVLRELEKALSVAEDIFRDLQHEPLKTVRAWVTRQVFTNVLDLALIAEHLSAGSASSWRVPLRRLLRRLREEGLSPDGKKQLNDVLSDAIYWVAKAILDDDPKARKSAAARARQFRAHNERDRQRVEAFVSLALARNPN